jgi:hypothetical protein
MFCWIKHSTLIFWGFCLFLLICRTIKPETVSLNELREQHLSIVYYSNVFKSLTSNVQPGLINNFVPYNNRYYVFYEKYMPIKTSFHGSPSLLCVALFTLLVLFWTRTPHLPSLPPISPNCYLPKSGRHVTSLDQGLSSSEARSGKSLGTRLCSDLQPSHGVLLGWCIVPMDPLLANGHSICPLDPMDTQKSNGKLEVHLSHLTNGMSNGLLIFPSDILHRYWTCMCFVSFQ